MKIFPWQKNPEDEVYVEPASPKKRSRTTRSIEQQERLLELKQKRIGHEMLIEELKNAKGEEKRNIIMQITGVEMVPKEEGTIEDRIVQEELLKDPRFREAVKNARLAEYNTKDAVSIDQQMTETITALALEQLKSNPALLSEMVTKRVTQLVTGGNGTDKEEFSELEHLLKTMDNMDELQKRFGKDKDGGSGLGAEVLKTIASLAPMFMGIIPGQPTLLPAQAKSGRDAEPHVRQIERTEVKTDEAPPHNAKEGSPSHEEKDESESTFDLSTWVTKLDKDPRDVVDLMIENAGQGDKDAIYALNLLGKYSAADILAMIQPFKANAALTENIQKLEDNKSWLEECVAYVQEILAAKKRELNPEHILSEDENPAEDEGIIIVKGKTG